MSTDIKVSAREHSSVEAPGNESGDSVFYVRNEAAPEDQCKDWICVWNTCYCDNAGGQVTVSKVLVGLALVGAAVAGLL